MIDGLKGVLFLKVVVKKTLSMFFGFLLFATGILCILYSDLGLGPWDVFHMGISINTIFTFGQVIQLTGLFLLLISYFLGEKPGIGSLGNMIFVGLFVDLIDMTGLYRTPENLFIQFVMIIAGMFLIGWGTFFYLQVKLGAGPRDSLMVGLVKLLNKPVWMIRGGIELTALTAGYILGGPVGIGTLIVAVFIGYFVQLAFMLGGYNTKKARHTDLKEQFLSLRSKKIYY